MIAPSGMPTPQPLTIAESFRRQLGEDDPARDRTNPCGVDANGSYWTAEAAIRHTEQTGKNIQLTCGDCDGPLVLSRRGLTPYFRHRNRTDNCFKVTESASHRAIKDGFRIYNGWDTEHVVKVGPSAVTYKFDGFIDAGQTQIMLEVVRSGFDRYIGKQTTLDEHWPGLKQVYLFDSTSVKLTTNYQEEYFSLVDRQDGSNLRRLLLNNIISETGLELIGRLGFKRCFLFYAGQIWFSDNGQQWQQLKTDHWLTSVCWVQSGILDLMRHYRDERTAQLEENRFTFTPAVRYRDPRFSVADLPDSNLKVIGGMVAFLEDHPEWFDPKHKRPKHTGRGKSEPKEPVCNDPDAEDDNGPSEAMRELNKIAGVDLPGTGAVELILDDQTFDSDGRAVLAVEPELIEVQRARDAGLPQDAEQCGIPHPEEFNPQTFDYTDMMRRTSDLEPMGNYVILKVGSHNSYGTDLGYGKETHFIQFYPTIGGRGFPFRIWDQDNHLTRSFLDAVGADCFADIWRKAEFGQTYVVASIGWTRGVGSFYGPLKFWPYRSFPVED